MDNSHQKQIMYNLDKTSRKIQHSMRGNYIHSSLSKVYNLQFTCVLIILPLITVGGVWWLCFCILVMSCAFSHTLVTRLNFERELGFFPFSTTYNSASLSLFTHLSVIYNTHCVIKLLFQ